MDKASDARQVRCPKCKDFYEFFVGLPPKACPECLQKREAQIQHVRELIRENKGINAMELNKHTGVPVGFIMKMLQEGDIELA
ncbi:MAG: hypothetical protein FWF77_06280 [Defluviitaleaceae bacterium]|nr:hypothetical protein [Defluviitaleaceae bacterium]